MTGLRIGSCRFGVQCYAVVEEVGVGHAIRCPRSETRNPLRRGLTLAEMIVSIAIVGVMLVAALNTVGASRIGCSLMPR